MSAIMDLAKSLVRVPMLYSLYVHARVVGTLLIMPQSRPWGAKEIVPGLFLGNLGDSLQYSALKEHGITHVVSVIQSIPSYPYTGYLVRVNGFEVCALHGCMHAACMHRCAVLVEKGGSKHWMFVACVCWPMAAWLS
jgi:hypothetical protein